MEFRFSVIAARVFLDRFFIPVRSVTELNKRKLKDQETKLSRLSVFEYLGYIKIVFLAEEKPSSRVVLFFTFLFCFYFSVFIFWD